MATHDHQGGGPGQVTTTLDHRAVALPVELQVGSLRRAVFQVARTVAAGDLMGADRSASALAARAEGDDPAPREQRLRAAVLARLFVDLATAGWELWIEDAAIFAAAPRVDVIADDAALLAAKEATRRTMLARVREQVVRDRRLIHEVEPELGGILAHGPSLARALAERGADAVQPYLQPARGADPTDVHTRLPPHSIFRYLRYWWAFPYNDTPGRSLPFLIRDAGQPNHPVCGLLCLSSPLLRLTDRDDALGLTPAWLEAVAASLRAVTASDPAAALTSLEHDLRRQARAALSPDRVFRDVGELLKLELAVAKWARRTAQGERLARAEEAAASIVSDLVRELRDAIGGVSFDGLGCSLAGALAAPDVAATALEGLAAQADLEWKEGRREAAPRGAAEDLVRLFKKKRARQLALLLRGWQDLRCVVDLLHEGRALDALSELPRLPLSAGELVGRGLKEALLVRKVRLASTQIADISLCGAIPPYNGLLGGKLAAMLALSREAAQAWFDAYASSVSDIQSQMAGEAVVRPAELVAMTTTSFYGVGSSQYHRVSLPSGERWEEVGQTRGHGTLHLSAELCELLGKLVVEIEGARRITSTFGEGPSERLRKLRDGMTKLNLPHSRLLRHGFTRVVYVAPLGGRTYPGASKVGSEHHFTGPTQAAIGDAWRSRWLAPRIEQAMLAAAAFDPNTVRVSARFAAELASTLPAPRALVYDEAPVAEASDGAP